MVESVKISWNDIEISLTNFCYFNCPMCVVKTKNPEFIDTSVILDNIDELLNIRDVCVTLTGGEPLTHPSFTKFISELNERNIPWRIYT
jgi:MoaA/NifB/PqqE/SkfB family radical SAM enzyme